MILACWNSPSSTARTGAWIVQCTGLIRPADRAQCPHRRELLKTG